MCRARHRTHLQCSQKGSDYVRESARPRKRQGGGENAPQRHAHTHETRGPNNCGEVTLIQLPAGDSGSNKEKMTQLQPGRRSAGPGGGGGGDLGGRQDG